MMYQEGQILKYQGKDFKLEKIIKILNVGLDTYFVKVIFPESWNLKYKEKVMDINTVDNNYKPVD